MPLVIGVDTTIFYHQTRLALQVAEQELQRALPIELNNSGHALAYDVTLAVAEEFPDVPLGVIAAAITSREATDLVPSFTIASRDAMVTYVEWVTQRDEKVCPICGPRDGVIYRIIDVMDIWPAHPNCRCLINRLGITDAMLRAGSELLPDAMQRVAEGLLEHFARVWSRF